MKTKYFLAPILSFCVIAGLAHAQDTNKTYLAFLEQAAEDLNYDISAPPVKSCIKTAVVLTPETVKVKATELQSVDINLLQRSGVPKEDIKTAVKAVTPCLRLIGVTPPQVN